MGRAHDLGPDVVLDSPAFVHPSATLHGRVRLAEGASVWPNAVIRAEVHDVDIGAFTNVQDFVMVHVDFGGGVRIGPYCSITHHAVVHGSMIGANCLIGLNATIMDGCVIGDNCVIGAGALCAPRAPRSPPIRSRWACRRASSDRATILSPTG